MASLTRIATTSRKVIRYGVYVIILLIIGRFAFKTGVAIYKTIFPPPPPEPTVDFGKLTELPFPPRPERSEISYSLETAEGGLPELPGQLPVYFMPPVASNIRALDLAKTKAASLGFSSEGRVLFENVPNVYIFDKGRVPSTLTMNIVTGVFSINYDISADPSVIGKVPPEPNQAIERARSLFSNAGLIKGDLRGPTNTQLLQIKGGEFVPAISLAESDVIKVNLFRKNYAEEIPAVTPEYPESNVWVMFSGAGGNRSVIAAEYHHFPVDEDRSGTYPIKTVEAAWEELRGGAGYIANPGDNQDEVTIRRVYIGYYDPGQYTQFYQPVVVFEGDNDFIAYVPAVTDEFYGE